MVVGFDASRAFDIEATGTQNYSLSLLQALAKIDRKNKYRVYLRRFAGPVSSFPPASARSKLKSIIDEVDKVELRAVGSPSRTATRKLANYPTISFESETLRVDDQLANWPKNFEFVQVRPNRLWTQLGLALETWRNPVDVLFVPAHTLPILRRRKIGEFQISNLKFKIDFFAKQMKYVVTMHDLGVEFLPGYHSFPGRYYLDLASKYAARAADALIAVSEATKTDLVSRYKIPVEKIFVVHEGVDTGFFKAQSKSKVKSVKSKYKIRGNYVLYVGTVQPRKNLETLIRAFGELLSQSRKSKWKEGTKAGLYTHDFDLSLMIAGKLGWDFRQIVNLPKKLGIEDSVRFLGYVDRADLPALYSGAAVFAFPSLFEGFGLPILEALACGCPVIASNIAPHCEIFDNFKFRGADVPMVLTKPKDIDQWSSFLYQYVSQYDKRLSIGTKFRSVKAVRSALASEFSWEKVARQTLKVIEERFAIELK